MRRTLALAVLGLVSVAIASAIAFLQRPGPLPPPREGHVAAGPLRVSAQLDRRYLREGQDGTAYLEIELTAPPEERGRARVPVNAVLLLDRSGSMHGMKIEQARAAAATLVEALGEMDRLTIIAFDSGAEVLVPSSKVTNDVKATARRRIAGLRAMGETNFSAAFELAGLQLAAGRREGQVDEVFLASDGRVTSGELDPARLVRAARARFGRATLSTFGIGEDYDEDLMRLLADAGGGRMQFIEDVSTLPRAFAAELGRANRIVATDVRLRVAAPAGGTVERVFGYEPVDGVVRVPDFAAGDERHVLLRLAFRGGTGTAGVAAVEVEYVDAAGRARRAAASAQATFTADARLLAEPPGRAAVDGARAEMADLARAAALEEEAGRRDQAAEKLDQLARVAASAPAPHLRDEARLYSMSVSAIVSQGDVAAKAVKQKSFDAVRAPVAGW